MTAQQLGGVVTRFTIYDLDHPEGPLPVGVSTLVPDDSVRTGEVEIMLAPEARGRGLGTAATKLTLDYAFHISNLRMVWLKVLAPNTPAIAAYKKAGFRRVGALPEAGYWLGQVCDEVLMAVLAADFNGSSAITPLVHGGRRAPAPDRR